MMKLWIKPYIHDSGQTVFQFCILSPLIPCSKSFQGLFKKSDLVSYVVEFNVTFQLKSKGKLMETGFLNEEMRKKTLPR